MMDAPTLYEKRGRRYVPVAIDRTYDSWPAGFHLVYARPSGGVLTRFSINPDHLSVLAAVEPMRDEIRELVLEALAARPARRPVTPAQKKAWDDFVTAMGNDRFCVEYESAQGLADRVAELVINRAAWNAQGYPPQLNQAQALRSKSSF